MRHSDIALALGISRETLAKHYPAELSAVASLRRLEILSALHAAAKKGSTSAAKAYLASEPELAAAPIVPGELPQPPAPQAVVTNAAKVGKKEQAQADAVTAAAGTDWADLLKAPAAPLQ